MFIRIKKNKSGKYAYLVQNKWYKTHMQARQKTKKYLGKVISLEKKNNFTFNHHFSINSVEQYVKKNSTNKIFLDLIRLELANHSFKESKKDIWQYENIVVDLKNKKVYNQKTDKPLCLELNDNFLTQQTLTKLFRFQPPTQSTKLQIGKSLANTILASGIKIEQDLFLQIFDKMYGSLR